MNSIQEKIDRCGSVTPSWCLLPLTGADAWPSSLAWCPLPSSSWTDCPMPMAS